jgi:hypothetical protein
METPPSFGETRDAYGLMQGGKAMTSRPSSRLSPTPRGRVQARGININSKSEGNLIMKKHEAYPSKYLKAADIPSPPPMATIRSVAHERMQDDALKPVVYFDGWQKGVVCNVTNADVLYELAKSDDDADWPGLTIELHTEMVRFQGKTAPSIRFRVPQRNSAPRPRPVARSADEPPPHQTVPEYLDDKIPF